MMPPVARRLRTMRWRSDARRQEALPKRDLGLRSERMWKMKRKIKTAFLTVGLCLTATVLLAGNITYTYDAAGRLIQADYGPIGIISYTYDANGNLLTKNVAASPAIPGDGNGDGIVTIGEVQKVIRMHLRLDPPGYGADCDGNGQISIGEVQKVIRAHLRLDSSC